MATELQNPRKYRVIWCTINRLSPLHALSVSRFNFPLFPVKCPQGQGHGVICMIKTAPCHSTAGGDFVTMARSLTLKFKSCAQDNCMRVETGQKWKARVGKPAIACVAADSFLFQVARRSNKRTKSGRAKEHAWGEPKNWGEVGRGSVRRGRGWGGKEPPAVNPKHFTELRSLTNGEQ